MIVVKTLEEAKKATAGFTTTYFIFQKKKILQAYAQYQDVMNIVNTDIINKGRRFGNQVMVGFWYFDPWYFNANTDKSSAMWDRTSYVSWAAQQRIDVLWIPEFEDEEAIINGPISKYYEKEIDRIWKEERYEDFFINSTNKIQMKKLKNICLNFLVCNTGWKYMISNGDGISGLIQVHFINNHTDSRAGLISAVKSHEGLNCSLSYFRYTEKEKEFLAKVEPTIRAFNLSDDIGILKDQLDVFGKEIDLKIKRLEKFSDNKFLGPGKKLVEVEFSVGKNFDTKYDHFSVLIN